MTAPDPLPAITGFEPVYEGWSRFGVATVRTGRGETVRRVVESHGDAVAVLPYDPTKRVALLVSQFRAPVMHAAGLPALLEVPAGLDDGENAVVAARREALEEVGVRLRTLQKVARAWSIPGLSTERVALFLAPYDEVDRVAAGGGADGENEEITVREIPLDELAAAVGSGGIDDMKTVCLVLALRLARPDLFGPR